MDRIKNARGLTLLEVVIVLAITGLVIGAIWLVVADTMLHNQINQTERAITTTATRIRDFYRDRPINATTDPLNNTKAIAANLISPDLVVNSTTLQYKIGQGGPVNVATNNCTGSFTNPTYGFEIELDFVPANACTQLATALAGTSSKIQSNGIIGLYIVGTNVIIAGAPPTFDQASAQTKCANAATMEFCFVQAN